MKQTGKLLRTLAALLALLLLCGCGAQEAAQPQGAEAPQPESQEAETAETQEPAPTEAPAPAPTEAPAPEPVTVSVSNVDELLDAIAPNTVIEMAPGVYDLSVAVNYGRLDASPYYTWNMAPTYDEPEFGLEIHDVEGLTIRGAGKGVSILNAVPRDVFVLSFRGCSGVSVEGITAGHSPEGGACMGGVLDFEACTGAKVQGCGLFGCGTVGVYGRGSNGISVLDSQIYECSSAGVQTETCRDVRVDGCEVFEIGKADFPAYALFQANGTDGFAVTNCSVYSNNAGYLFLSSGSRNCYFLSNMVSNNVLVYGFLTYDKPCTVGGCSFTGPEGAVYAWAGPEGLSPVDLTGKSLSEQELFFMEYAAIDPAELLPQQEALPAEQTLTVTNADELLAAIGPNRTIVLEGSSFDLSSARGYGNSESPYYRWVRCYDGWELQISWVEGLHLRAEGEDPAATVLVTSPRYANVLSFRGCKDVSLEGFTLGHTQAPGSCAGGVVDFGYGSGLRLENCRLYGCGVLGLSASESRDLALIGCEIYDCSDGGLSLFQVEDARFEGCSIHDVPCPGLNLYGCSAVTWEGEELRDGWYNQDRRSGELIALPEELLYTDLGPENLELEELCLLYQGQYLGSLELTEQNSVILTAMGYYPYGISAARSCTWSCDNPGALQLSPLDGGTRCIVKALRPVDGDVTLVIDCGSFRGEVPVHITARG